jgi:hypothetical protein
MLSRLGGSWSVAFDTASSNSSVSTLNSSRQLSMMAEASCGILAPVEPANAIPVNNPQLCRVNSSTILSRQYMKSSSQSKKRESSECLNHSVILEKRLS